MTHSITLALAWNDRHCLFVCEMETAPIHSKPQLQRTTSNLKRGKPYQTPLPQALGVIDPKEIKRCYYNPSQKFDSSSRENNSANKGIECLHYSCPTENWFTEQDKQRPTLLSILTKLSCTGYWARHAVQTVRYCRSPCFSLCKSFSP